MTRRVLLSLLPALLLPGAQKKGKGPKPPQVEVVQVAARRAAEGIIEFDGRVRNCGEKPIRKLILVFHILAPGKQVISTQKGALGEEILEPGEDAEFHWQMRDHVRAVRFEVAAVDRAGNDLLVDKPGPYAIE